MALELQNVCAEQLATVGQHYNCHGVHAIASHLLYYLLDNYLNPMPQLGREWSLGVLQGKVQKLPTPKRCHHCVDCSQESLEFYEWITDEPAVAINQQECCSHGTEASVQ